MISDSPLSERINQYFTTQSGDIRYIFSPFIQRDTIARILPEAGTDTIVITRWRREDLRSGVSDPEVYKFCKNNGYTLKIHPRLHAKVYSWDLEDAIVGSANLTDDGMEEGSSSNIELLTEPLDLSIAMELKLRQAEKNSQIVTESTYETAIEVEKKSTVKPEQDDESIDVGNQPEFLTSQLPTTEDPYLIVSVLAGNQDRSLEDLPAPERRCVLHDIASYSLEDLDGLPEDEVRGCLQHRFENHPFIKEIIQNMDPDIYFGEMKELVQRKCVDVPTPSRRELTGDVQLLYTWFRDVSSDRFLYDIPGARSERLRDTHWSGDDQ